MDPKEQFDKQAKHYSSSKTFSSGQGLKIYPKNNDPKIFTIKVETGNPPIFGIYR